jgi:purine-binding chemotaxis protein CheW
MSRNEGKELDELALGGDLLLATEDNYLRAADRREQAARRGVLTFHVAGEVYGIEILDVREIIKVGEITEVPRTAGFLLGIISVRGSIMPVIDLRQRLGFPTTSGVNRQSRILVVMRGADRFGLLVDAVGGVMRFLETEIEPPPSALSAHEASYLAGIARQSEEREEKIVILLELSTVVTFDFGWQRTQDNPREVRT